MARIVELRLTGQEADVAVVRMVLDVVFAGAVHIGAPQASRNPKYHGSFLSRGTVDVDTLVQLVAALEALRSDNPQGSEQEGEQ